MTAAVLPTEQPVLTLGALARGVLEEARVLVVAGLPFGVLVAGLGSRLSMMLLRFTSDPDPRGVISDDDFLIGQTTLGGTYSLMALGAFVGLLGAGLYKMVRPWLIGPRWFRRLTVGLACGAVVGSMLVHEEGVDFRVLGPTWLAIGLFVALPFLFGALIGPTVDRVEAAASIGTPGRARWILPVVLLGLFPVSIFAFAFIAPLLILCVALREVDVIRKWRALPLYGLAVRAIWLSIAVLGLGALVNDVRAIY